MNTTTFVLLAISIPFLSIVYSILIYPFYISPLRHLPTVSPSQWIQTSDSSPIEWDKWFRTVPNRGLIRYHSLYNAETLLVTSPETIQEVLSNTQVLQRFFIPFLELIVGPTSFFLAYGAAHKVSRRRVQPAFGAPHVKEMYPIFWLKSKELVNVLTEKIGSKHAPAAIDWSLWSGRVTLDVMGLAGFSDEFDCLVEGKNSLAESYRTVLGPALYNNPRIFNRLSTLCPDWRWLQYRLIPHVFRGTTALRETAKQMIAKRAEQIKAHELKLIDPKDVLGLTMRNENCTTDELVDYCLTFLMAGHETTSSALIWAVYALCTNGSLQTRLRAEIREHLAPLQSDVSPTPSDFDKMPLFTAFVNEVLRFYPPIGRFSRQTLADTMIGGEFIPRGTKVVISPLAFNHSPTGWQPTQYCDSPSWKFDPNRWLDFSTTPPTITNGGATSGLSNLGFGYGVKGCIGERFAKAEIMVSMASFIGAFEFDLKGVGKIGQSIEKATIVDNISHEIVGGLWVGMRRIEGW